jgi:serine/threonine-protein kinase ULK/ATG1
VSDQLGTCISTGRVEEQLALYQLALELLSNALQLARREIESGKLMKSSSVRKIVKQLIELRSQSLDWYKKLLTVEFSSVRLPVPEKLVFMHAVELCQDCVDRETMMTDGSDTDCKAGYLRALLLLEGLLDNADNPCDRRLLTESKAVLEQHIHAGLPSQID